MSIATSTKMNSTNKIANKENTNKSKYSYCSTISRL